MPKLRLVKVIIQPVIVVDHGDWLQEINESPRDITAQEWPTYSSEQFPRELAEVQAALDAQEDEKDEVPSAGTEPDRKADP